MQCWTCCQHYNIELNETIRREIQYIDCKMFTGTHTYIHVYTVEPPNQGHSGTICSVPCREIIPFLERLVY